MINWKNTKSAKSCYKMWEMLYYLQLTGLTGRLQRKYFLDPDPGIRQVDSSAYTDQFIK